MSNLTADRNTKERANKIFEFGVKAAAKIYGGAIVCLDAAGKAVRGATATTLITVGRAEALADNTAGADDAIKVRTARGTFQFANSAAGDLIAATEIGKSCYVVDDQTVAKTNGTSTRSVAGIVRDVDAGGVWVEI